MCVCVHLHVCLSQLCHSSEQQRLFRFMRAAQHSAPAKLPLSSSSTASSSSSCSSTTFFPLNFPVCLSSHDSFPPVSVTSFTFLSLLQPCRLFIHSHPFILSLSLPPAQCPLSLPPSIIRAICWKGKAERSDNGHNCVECGVCALQS